MMKKIANIIIIIALILFLSSCNQTYEYVYMHDQDDIITIDIISAEEGTVEPIITYIASIDESMHDAFIEELNQIEFQKYLYDEHPSIYNKQAIMITYLNGDYEIITYDAQMVFFHTDNSSEPRRFYTNQEDFEQLLMSYMTS
jgi:hypothetical protein